MEKKLHSCVEDKENHKIGSEGVRSGVGWVTATKSGFYFKLKTL